MQRETWYVLEDGSVADPSEVAPDDAGRLIHKSGVAVAMRGRDPHTSGVDPEAERAKNALPPDDGNALPPDAKEMEPEQHKRGYKTRQAKAE